MQIEFQIISRDQVAGWGEQQIAQRFAAHFCLVKTPKADMGLFVGWGGVGF